MNEPGADFQTPALAAKAQERLQKSETRLRRLTDRMSAIIFELNAQGMLLEANEPFTRTTGYILDELRGQAWWELLFLGEQRQQAEKLFRLVESGDVSNFELALTCKNSTLAIFEISTANDYAPDGTLEKINGFGMNITQQKAAEKALQQREAHLQILLNQVPAILGSTDTRLQITSSGGPGLNIDNLDLDQSTVVTNSEARYRAIVEDQTELICRWLPDGTLTFANHAYCRFFGINYDDLFGSNFLMMIPEEDREIIRSLIQRYSADNPEWHSEHRVLLPNGEVRWQQWFDRGFFDEQGRLVEVQSVGRDITEQKQAEQAVQRQTAFIRLLQEVAIAANQAASIEEVIQFCLDRLCAFSKWSVGHAWLRENFQGDLVSAKIWHIEDANRYASFRQESEKLRISDNQGLAGLVLANKEPLWFTEVDHVPEFIRRISNIERQVRMGVAFPIWTGKEIVGVLEFFSDQSCPPDLALLDVMGHIGTTLGRVVERKRLESEVAELQRRLMDDREAERVHLARELHDGPVQDLYGISFNLKAFCQGLPEEIDLAPAKELQEALHKVARTLRQITGELRPPTLSYFGLEKAIHSHAEMFKEAYPDLDVLLDLAPDGQTLPEEVRLALFRIYQHVLNNVSRHSQAKQVLISLVLDEDQIILEIIDNGTGFNVPSRWIDIAREGHLGLAGAFERAQAIGGLLTVQSAPGKGTKVRVSVPRVLQVKMEV